jgi:hypothetical protein
MNNFPTLLRNASSIEEMLHVFPQQSYLNISDVKYGLTWNWFTIGKRRVVGHQGSLPAVTTLMVANERRNLGVIILTNGDVLTPTNQSIETGEIMSKLVTQLFDCFEKNGSRSIKRRMHFIHFWWMACVLSFYLFNF